MQNFIFLSVKNFYTEHNCISKMTFKNLLCSWYWVILLFYFFFVKNLFWIFILSIDHDFRMNFIQFNPKQTLYLKYYSCLILILTLYHSFVFFFYGIHKIHSFLNLLKIFMFWLKCYSYLQRVIFFLKHEII